MSISYQNNAPPVKLQGFYLLSAIDPLRRLTVFVWFGMFVSKKKILQDRYRIVPLVRNAGQAQYGGL